MQGRMNIPTHGGGGGELSLNIFAQAAEPTTKEGIWINTSASGSLPRIENFDYDGIEIANTDFRNASNGNIVYRIRIDIPYSFYQGSAVAMGTDIYLLGSNDSSTRKYAYKYNTLTDSYTKMTDIPYSFYNGSAAAMGADIYLFGGGDSSTRKYAYKYNTLTDSYTKMTDIPYSFYNGSAVAMGTDIYLFGGGLSSHRQYAHKYNTLTDSYTKMTDIPYSFYYGSAAAMGTDIYLFGTNDSSYSKYAYKYNTLTDSYTKMTDIPYNFYNGSAVSMGTGIYLFGTTDIRDIKSKVYNVQFKNGYIYLFSVDNMYETKISDNLNIPVFYARICKDNTLQAYPAYYGDGTQWNRLPD